MILLYYDTVASEVCVHVELQVFNSFLFSSSPMVGVRGINWPAGYTACAVTLNREAFSWVLRRQGFGMTAPSPENAAIRTKYEVY